LITKNTEFEIELNWIEMSPNLKGKVCLVTGATKGIGRGIALQLGSSGAKVYLTGRTEELLQSCAKEINERGGEAFPIKVDHGNDKVVFLIHNTIYYGFS
jgi:short-subunit dehydrogenase